MALGRDKRLKRGKLDNSNRFSSGKKIIKADNNLHANLLKKEGAALYLKQLEDKLGYYKQVVIDSNDAIIIQDFNGVIKAWNKGAEKIYGFNEKEMLGKNIVKIIASKEIRDARKNISAVKQGKPSFKVRQTRINKNKEKIFVNITYSPIYENEELIEIATTEEDVTSLKESLAELKKSLDELKLKYQEKDVDLAASIKRIREESEKRREAETKVFHMEKLAALGRLTGILGHELRNPLSVIRNSTYYLSTLNLKDKVIKKYIQIMNEEAINAENVINGIFLFSRTKEMYKKTLDVNKKIKSIIKELRLHDGINVIFKLNKIPSIAMGDMHLSQIIKNIISNAVEAMPHGGAITIEARRKNKNIEISIADTGNGILKKNIRKLFTPLYTTKYKGMGLGLTVCVHILSLYNGTIEAESELKKGAKFTIKIPIGRKKGGSINEKNNPIN